MAILIDASGKVTSEPVSHEYPVHQRPHPADMDFFGSAPFGRPISAEPAMFRVQRFRRHRLAVAVDEIFVEERPPAPAPTTMRIPPAHVSTAPILLTEVATATAQACGWRDFIDQQYVWVPDPGLVECRVPSEITATQAREYAWALLRAADEADELEATERANRPPRKFA